VAALVAAPLIKHGRFTAILSVQSAQPRRWSAAEVTVVEEAAGRTWEALERARVEARLLATQAQQAFLLALGDRLRRHETAPDVLREAVEMLGRHLGVAGSVTPKWIWKRTC
jgi:GAF domain-containing protein